VGCKPIRNILKVVTSIIPEVRISTRSENFHAKVRGKEILRDAEGPERATKVLQLQHGLQKRVGNARATCSEDRVLGPTSRLWIQKREDGF